MLLPEIGPAGQRKIAAGRVLIVGTGGLGSPAACYLAAAGVGRLGIIDGDTVDLSNLGRQIIHHTPDVGRLKVESAKEKLDRLNPDIEVVAHDGRLTSANALELFAGYDVIVDATDNFTTRYLINDACVLTKRPFVHGSVLRFEGQASTFIPGAGPCYRCLYPSPPAPGTVPSCQEAGVLGPVPGIIGTIQALETLKLLTGAGQTLAGRLLLFDGLSMRFDEVRLRSDLGCAVCGDHPTIKGLIDYEAFCGAPPVGGTNA
jgi:adenylyltransferase/sulfurtransferase